MAKSKTNRKTKRSSSRSNSRPARQVGLRSWLGSLQIPHRLETAGVKTRLLLIMTCLAVGAAALWAMEWSVLDRQNSAGKITYRLELVDTPGWMSRSLGRELHEDIVPSTDFTDDSLCQQVHQRAMANPWVEKVKEVRRIYNSEQKNGLVQMRAVYRQPLAKVQYDNKIYFVDRQNVVLPGDSVPRWAAKIGEFYRYYTCEEAVPLSARPLRIHYIVIQGVETAPPAVGQAWEAADLKHGLRLVTLVSKHHWANQVTVADVRNHSKRISESEPELRLYAQQGQSRPTDILFGRFPNTAGGDWVIPPDRKMKYINDYVSEHDGKLAGVNAYIDVRYDELRISVN